MNTNTRKTLLASMVGLFAAGGVATATAQDSVGESARAQGVLDEIIVTSERREASLQEVPIAITAFTGDELANAGIDGSEALELVTPGLSFLSVAELGVITIRGVGSPFLQGSALDPSTSVYIDGVYQSRFTSAHLKLMDIERVEVLKGPQGVLYGRNSPGGAINYITQGPQNELGAKLNVSVGNYDLKKIQGQFDIPIIEDTLLFRGAVHRETREGYSENLLIPSDELEEEDLFAARFALQYLPSETVDIMLRAGMSDREGGLLPAFKVEKIDPAAPNAGMEVIDDPRKINADQPNYTSFNDEYIDLTVKFDMGWATLSSISAYIDREVGPKIRDVDGSELALGHQGQPGVRNGTVYDTESFSQEFLLSSNEDRELDWLFGLFYFKENPDILGGFDAPFVDLFFVTSSQAETTAYAAFGHLSYDVLEDLRVNLGLRYSSEDREHTFTQYINSDLVAGPETLSDSWSSFTPKLGLDYFVNEDVMVYFSLSSGFKSGGFSAANDALDEETVDAIELGVKSTLMDGRMTLNASAFSYDYEDMQVNSVDPDTLFSSVRNAGSAEIQGLEIEMSALPIESLQIDIGLSFLDTEFTDFAVNDARVPSGNLSGNNLPNSPEFTANLGLKYTNDIDGLGELAMQADYYYSAEAFHSEYNDQRNHDSYYNLNIRASLLTESEAWRLSIFGKNVTDELVRDYTIDGAFLFGSGYLAQYAPPRTYGMEITYQF